MPLKILLICCAQIASEEQRKSYLQKDPKTLGGRHIWKCPRCSTAVMVDQGAAPGTG